MLMTALLLKTSKFLLLARPSLLCIPGMRHRGCQEPLGRGEMCPQHLMVHHEPHRAGQGRYEVTPVEIQHDWGTGECQKDSHVERKIGIEFRWQSIKNASRGVWFIIVRCIHCCKHKIRAGTISRRLNSGLNIASAICPFCQCPQFTRTDWHQHIMSYS